MNSPYLKQVEKEGIVVYDIDPEIEYIKSLVRKAER